MAVGLGRPPGRSLVEYMLKMVILEDHVRSPSRSGARGEIRDRRVNDNSHFTRRDVLIWEELLCTKE